VTKIKGLKAPCVKWKEEIEELGWGQDHRNKDVLCAHGAEGCCGQVIPQSFWTIRGMTVDDPATLRRCADDR